MASPSPFLLPFKTHSQPSTLSVLHLSRDLLEPLILDAGPNTHDGYVEGRVLNTRFGSYPHSTLINRELGSQIRASNVDTGGRSKRVRGGDRKRKRREVDDDALDPPMRVDAEVEMVTDESMPSTPMKDGYVDLQRPQVPLIAPSATSGFAHLLPPTPELWTAALPHRTQVVYTPDYSYILQRLRVQPGCRIIEAGAGSGSFTHAAARAVYDGHVKTNSIDDAESANDESEVRASESKSSPRTRGKVWSYEFHEQRVAKVRAEIRDHGLESIVTSTHQDVCASGFAVTDDSEPILANAVFLDLPAPWLALPHLTRKSSKTAPILNPRSSVHICTFSPCIEQVQRTVSTLRSLGWLEISMTEIAAKRVETRRERVGLCEEGLRGANSTPANVEEALKRLKEVEGQSQSYHQTGVQQQEGNSPDAAHGAIDRATHLDGEAQWSKICSTSAQDKSSSRQARLSSAQAQLPNRRLYKEGRLITRDEQSLKEHTSYLVFATLPREWSTEDESEAQKQLPSLVAQGMGEERPMSKRQMKRAARQE